MISLNATVVALARSEELYTETRTLLEDKMMPPPPEDDGEIEEDQASLAIVLQIALTAAAMLIGYAAERKHLSWLPEGVCALLLGVFVGIIMHFTEDDEDTILELVDFDPEFFFFVLLPPIIFESGYSMRPYYFFKNIGGICVFAFLGTLVSTVIIGTLMYLAGQIGICDELGILDSLIFGSLISATDPVSVLAVFSKLGTGIHLYNLVFGESVLNDAVALVLYRILLKFHGEDFKFASVFSGIGFFCLVLFGSVAIGVLMALIAGFLYRAIDFRHGALADEFVVLEASFLILIPFFAYFLADGLDLSGIVAILFAGITMARYVRPNLSQKAQDATLYFFKLLAHISETFVFIYMGVSMFLVQATFSVSFIAVALVVVLGSRAGNVYPLGWLVNKFRRLDRQISMKELHMMFFSGLRGAIAFALSLQAYKTDIEGDAGDLMFTTTGIIVLVTSIFIGGGTSKMLQILNLLGDEYEALDDEDHLREEEMKEQRAMEVPYQMLSLLPRKLQIKAKMERGVTQVKKVFRFRTWDAILHGLVGVDKPSTDPKTSQFDDSLELDTGAPSTSIEMIESPTGAGHSSFLMTATSRSSGSEEDKEEGKPASGESDEVRMEPVPSSDTETAFNNGLERGKGDSEGDDGRNDTGPATAKKD